MIMRRVVVGALLVGLLGVVGCGDDGDAVVGIDEPGGRADEPATGGDGGDDAGDDGGDGVSTDGGPGAGDDPVQDLSSRCAAIGELLGTELDLADVEAVPNTHVQEDSRTDDPAHDTVGMGCNVDLDGDGELLIMVEVPAAGGAASEDLQRLWSAEAIVSLEGDQAEITERRQLSLEDSVEPVEVGERGRFITQQPAFGRIESNLYVLATPDVGMRLRVRYPDSAPGPLLERDAMVTAARITLDQLGLT